MLIAGDLPAAHPELAWTPTFRCAAKAWSCQFWMKAGPRLLATSQTHSTSTYALSGNAPRLSERPGRRRGRRVVALRLSRHEPDCCQLVASRRHDDAPGICVDSGQGNACGVHARDRAGSVVALA